MGFLEQFGKREDDDEMDDIVQTYLKSRERLAGMVGERFEHRSVQAVIRKRDELVGMIGPMSDARQIQWVAEQLEALSSDALQAIVDMEHGGDEMIAAASSIGKAAATVREMVGVQRDHDRELKKIYDDAYEYCSNLRDETNKRLRERREARESIESRKRSILCECGRAKSEGNLYCIYCYDEYRRRG